MADRYFAKGGLPFARVVVDKYFRRFANLRPDALLGLGVCFFGGHYRRNRRNVFSGRMASLHAARR